MDRQARFNIVDASKDFGIHWSLLPNPLPSAQIPLVDLKAGPGPRSTPPRGHFDRLRTETEAVGVGIGRWLPQRDLPFKRTTFDCISEMKEYLSKLTVIVAD